MNRIYFSFPVFVILILTFSGCYYDKESELYPAATGCDTTNVTYSNTITPLMTDHCNVCHSTAVASGGIVTDNFNSLKIIAANGKLWGAVDHQQGYSPMPKSSGKLSDCNLSKIKKWIDAGSPNN